VQSKSSWACSSFRTATIGGDQQQPRLLGAQLTGFRWVARPTLVAAIGTKTRWRMLVFASRQTRRHPAVPRTPQRLRAHGFITGHFELKREAVTALALAEHDELAPSLMLVTGGSRDSLRLAPSGDARAEVDASP